MKDRILQFLSAQSISPAEFADKIGVQRSSMSHILNGRNHPSASFLQKMLQVYPDLNPRWLMIGDGAMNFVNDESGSSLVMQPDRKKDKVSHPIVNEEDNTRISDESSLFASSDSRVGMDTIQPVTSAKVPEHGTFHPDKQPEALSGSATAEVLVNEVASNKLPHFDSTSSNEKEIEQVLVFFKDKTFAVYKPS